MIVANRYSHRWNDGSFGVCNFGICHLYGATCRPCVAVYGYMKSPEVRIFTRPNPRAWVCGLYLL
ncbi:MAG: hypothetical protein LBH06_02640 [Rikenellaceae bacterium]|jgi:hypothetical protein|nr:hypothetical protein [Rikenellaceae bacterium]